MSSSFAPIIIFSYNRPKELQMTLESLLSCIGIEKYKIIVYCDGPKNQYDNQKTRKVLYYLKKVQKMRPLSIIASEINKGLANSVIEGVSNVLTGNDATIVLEDDLILSPNFLIYMQQALDFYQNDKNIFSVSGYTPNITFPKDYHKDFYFSPRASSWGWGTWKDRWETVDWEVKSYPSFKYNLKLQWQFTKGGIDLPRMLHNQMKGKINSWAIRWVYQQYLNQQATVYPTTSKLKNTGIGAAATHTKKTKRFDTTVDKGEQMVFEFEKFNGYNKKILKSFRKVFSMWRRLKDRF